LKINIIDTEDGSHTLLNGEINETYHSTFGAISESEHVFIKNGLQLLNFPVIHVFEIGFGTGLNALLSAIYAQNNGVLINYSTIEKYPLESNIIEKLNYASQLSYPELYRALHQAEWNTKIQISPNFNLKKYYQDLVQFDFDQTESPDIVFFDAFSPSKQPEMWQVDIFMHIYKKLSDNGILVTYAAAGVVKNALREAGFIVKRLKGPPGKHHMLLARKIKENTT